MLYMYINNTKEAVYTAAYMWIKDNLQQTLNDGKVGNMPASLYAFTKKVKSSDIAIIIQYSSNYWRFGQNYTTSKYLHGILAV